jgi:predicted small secreted protein
MKRLFIAMLISATTICCNTPQPATGSDPATSGATGTDAETGTKGTTTDSSTTGTAVTDTVRQR